MHTIRFPRSKLRVGAVAATLCLVTAAPSYAVDPNQVIDFRADTLRIDGGKKDSVLDGAVWVQKAVVYEGSTVSLTCDWSANLVGAAYWTTHVVQTWQVIVKKDGHTYGLGPASMPAGTKLGSKSTDTSGIRIPTPDNPVPYEGSSTSYNYGTSFKGSFGPLKWTAQGDGEHKFECVIPKTGFEEPNLSNNVATAFIEVLPVLKAGAPPGPAVAQPVAQPKAMLPSSPLKRGTPGPALATGAATPTIRPVISVISAAAAVQNNCRSPQPALIASVSLRNTGAPLPANQGTVYIKEIAGATNLGSAGIPLPALSSGETRNVSIPVITLSPYSTLPGTHQLGVHLNPQTKGGQPSFNKPASPYPFGATFPAGYCQQKIAPRVPAAGTPQSGETRGFNPQSAPPSRTPLKLPGR